MFKITYVTGDASYVSKTNADSPALSNLPKSVVQRIYIAYWMDFAAFNYSIEGY